MQRSALFSGTGTDMRTAIASGGRERVMFVVRCAPGKGELDRYKERQARRTQRKAGPIDTKESRVDTEEGRVDGHKGRR